MRTIYRITIFACALSASITTVALSNKLLLACTKEEGGQVIAYDLVKELIGGAVHLIKSSSAGRETLLKNAYCEFSKIEVSCSSDDRFKGGDFKMYTFGMEKDGTFSLVFHLETPSDAQCDPIEPVVDEKLECKLLGF